MKMLPHCGAKRRDLLTHGTQEVQGLHDGYDGSVFVWSHLLAVTVQQSCSPVPLSLLRLLQFKCAVSPS